LHHATTGAVPAWRKIHPFSRHPFMKVRTRFAPSPTGFLHIGGARTALFSWAFARRHEGVFILRIEDTDVARSTPEAVQAILDGMRWLGLNHDEGPFYQMQRMDRYKEVIAQMLASGSAYHCYTPAEELDRLRDEQRSRGEKPRYDGRWRPEAGKMLPPVPAGVQPVVRFRNPLDGVVAWNDHVKGRIEIANAELDDLIIARADGTPTYNFCVVVDDWDMGITHVIRGDDHVNNTPRQINILKALGASVPEYAHLSMILGDDGQKLSKRHGAVSVMQYDDDGFLPEAVLNYLARLGWSHGDDEIFTLEQFAAWFDLDHITSSAAQFNTEKLLWLNQQYLKTSDNGRLAEEARKRLERLGVDCAHGPALARAVALFKERVTTLNELADALHPLYAVVHPSEELRQEHLTPAALAALAALRDRLQGIEAWEKTVIGPAIKETAAAAGLKMPQVAIPLRVLLLGQAQSPSIDLVLEVMGRETVLDRMQRGLAVA
jgi:glutamyl-tRNA synthetase